jgi:hypothetical protein
MSMLPYVATALALTIAAIAAVRRCNAAVLVPVRVRSRYRGR